MENKEYESPKITVISLDPDASLMASKGGALPGSNTALGSFSSNGEEPNGML